MKKAWIIAAALLAFGAVAAIAGEVSESITNGNIAGPPGYVWDGSRWRRIKGTSGGSANITDTDRDREYSFYIANFYNDTLSLPNRSTDSTAVPIDVHNVRGVTWLVKIEGLRDSSTTVGQRIGVTTRWHTALIADSNSTVGNVVVKQANTSPYGVPDSIGTLTAIGAAVTFSGETVLVLDQGALWNSAARWFSIPMTVPPGVVGATVYLRYLTGDFAGCGVLNRCKVRVRVNAMGRAL